MKNIAKRILFLIIIFILLFVLNGCLSFFIGSIIDKQYVNDSTKDIIRQKGFPLVVTNVQAISSSKYTNGKGCEIVFKNLSDQEIKYVIFDVLALNEFEDLAFCEIRKKATATLKVTGPVKIDEKFPPIRNWSNLWYNSTIKKIRITKISVTFIDGSYKEFSEEEAKQMMKSFYELK